MAVRVRPATTLSIILLIAFAFQLIAILSVPITKKIYLSSYQGYKFGVFGLCSESTCSSVQIGYSSNDLEDLSGFSLPSNARHSLSKLLIVHPVSTGFTLILLFSTFLLHWHGPSSSLKFLFFILLWTIPTFLLSLLSFLVDILLFVPHVAWGGWIILASTVLIAISAVLLCIQRRTVSSRANMKGVGRNGDNVYGDDYQLEPLNYDFGTVDGVSEFKSNPHDDDEDEADVTSRSQRKPFIHGGNVNTSVNFDDTIQHETTYEDLNNYPSTTLYDTMRGTNDNSRQSGSTFQHDNVLAPVLNSYRGKFDQDFSNTPPLTSRYHDDDDQLNDNDTAPYPTHIPQATYDDLDNEDDLTKSQQKAPYPTNSPNDLFLFESPTTKPLGPRPRPLSQTESSLIPTGSDEDQQEENLQHQDIQEGNASGDIARQPTYRTKIEQTLNQLQPSVYSSDSLLNSTTDNLLGDDRVSPTRQRNIGPIEMGDTTQDTTEEFSQWNAGEGADDDSLYGANVINTPNKNVLNLTVDTQSTAKPSFNSPSLIPSDEEIDDDAVSSVYSSQIPSAIPSAIPTPIDASFTRQASLRQRNATNSNQFLTIPEGSTLKDPVLSPSESSTFEYPYPSPHDRRTTPAPSFSNESILSSTFTSVSQREINPKYFERNPEELKAYLMRQMNQQNLQPTPPLNSSQNGNKATSTADILIQSNPDFTIGSRLGGKSYKKK